ncbi:hypothetical protein JCM11641_006449 [Rhodosporidiobolus odoratus]
MANYKLLLVALLSLFTLTAAGPAGFTSHVANDQTNNVVIAFSSSQIAPVMPAQESPRLVKKDIVEEEKVVEDTVDFTVIESLPTRLLHRILDVHLAIIGAAFLLFCICNFKTLMEIKQQKHHFLVHSTRRRSPRCASTSFTFSRMAPRPSPRFVVPAGTQIGSSEFDCIHGTWMPSTSAYLNRPFSTADPRAFLPTRHELVSNVSMPLWAGHHDHLSEEERSLYPDPCAARGIGLKSGALPTTAGRLS